MTAVMGFDTSLSVTGVARVDVGLDAEGVLREVAWATAAVKVAGMTPVDVRGEMRRLRRMLASILVNVPHDVALSVVEGPAPSATFSGKADERAGLRWLLISQLVSRGPVVLVDPQTRAVLAWGRGMPRRKKGQASNAAKLPVLEAVRAMVPDALVPDHNVADAVALAHAGAHALGVPVDYTAAQSAAHVKVAWPVGGAGTVLAPGMKG